MTALEARTAVLEDPGLRGRALCQALSDATDGALRSLFAQATEADGGAGLALVATGGYGRGLLAPGSDLDVWLLAAPDRDAAEVAAVADRLWYPVWDAGLALGHAVRTVRQSLALAADDLDTATAALSVRHLAGEGALATELAERGLEQWRARRQRWLGELAARALDPARRATEVAFLLEPDLKVGRGGLRDVAALRWAEAARPVLLPGDADALTTAEDELLEVRVELHRGKRRPSDVLLLERQDDVAATVGGGDADALMGRVATAARSIAWIGDEVWERVEASLAGPSGRIAGGDRPLGPGLVLRERQVRVTTDADIAGDGSLVLRCAAAAASLGARIDRASLDRLAAEAPVLDGPWPPAARAALVQLLATGPAAVGVLEALDQRRLVERVLPEWSHLRSRPQRNVLHRYTVDRHMNEAAAEAAALVGGVDRPDLLLVGAWLHDVGKGRSGDHSEVGAALVEGIAPRMGFPPDDVEVLVALVRHHLLLPDVATRRDLDDGDVIAAVAAKVGSVARLDLLAALTEADSLATNTNVWTRWKAGLVATLVDRVAHVLGGGRAVDVVGRSAPGDEVREAMEAGRTLLAGADDTLRVVAPDRPGLFGRVAGVLALRGLDVLAADAESDEGGMASACFTVAPSADGEAHDWARVSIEVARALAGRVALDARLAERARHRRVPVGRALVADPSVRVDLSGDSSVVVEVRAADGVGVLYRITRALADLDLDIRLAKVSTLGAEVVDTFYVRSRSGEALDREAARELERAVLHQLSLV